MMCLWLCTSECCRRREHSWLATHCRRAEKESSHTRLKASAKCTTKKKNSRESSARRTPFGTIVSIAIVKCLCFSSQCVQLSMLPMRAELVKWLDKTGESEFLSQEDAGAHPVLCNEPLLLWLHKLLDPINVGTLPMTACFFAQHWNLTELPCVWLCASSPCFNSCPS